MRVRFVAVLTTGILVASNACPGQREQAVLKTQRLRTTIEYGVVRVGRHTIEELKPGATWRMGFNTASTLVTEAPILGKGGALVLPGGYRVLVHRSKADVFALSVVGAGWSVDPTNRAASAVVLAGALAKTSPNKKLSVKLARSKQEAVAKVHFGPHRLEIPFAVIPARTKKTSGWTVDVFSVPSGVWAAREKAGSTIPIARLTKGRGRKARALNLTLVGDQAFCAPALVAPTASFGFGDPEIPKAEAVAVGQVSWRDGQSDCATVELKKVGIKNGAVVLDVTVGHRAGRIEVRIPAARGR